MNLYRVKCLVTISCQICKLDVYVFADNEKESFEKAIKKCFHSYNKVLRCKPLHSVVVNS